MDKNEYLARLMRAKQQNQMKEEQGNNDQNRKFDQQFMTNFSRSRRGEEVGVLPEEPEKMQYQEMPVIPKEEQFTQEQLAKRQARQRIADSIQGLEGFEDGGIPEKKSFFSKLKKMCKK